MLKNPYFLENFFKNSTNLSPVHLFPILFFFANQPSFSKFEKKKQKKTNPKIIVRLTRGRKKGRKKGLDKQGKS